MGRDTRILSAATGHAGKDTPVVFITRRGPEGICNCGKCGSPHVHIVEKGGDLGNGSTDAVLLKQVFDANLDVDLAIQAGESSNLVAIGFDDRDGRRSERLEDLERTYGPLPATARVAAQGEATVLLFRRGGRRVRSASQLAGRKGVRLLGDGALVVLPPSVAANGRPWEWARPSGERGVAAIPEWLVPLCDLDQAGHDLEGSRVVRVGVDALRLLERIARGELKPIPVPWPNVARELGGGFRAGCHVLVGVPKSGKSQFVLILVLHAAKHGSPVAYVALELDEREVWTRLAAIETGRLWSSLVLREELEPEHTVAALRNVHDATLSRLPIHVMHGDAHGWSADSLGEIAEGLRRANPEARGTPLIVVDFLQLVTGEERDLRERIAAAAYQARMAARDHDVAVILVSSTAREFYARLDAEMALTESKGKGKPKPPGQGSPSRLIGLGKESGEIEYAADTVLVLTRDPSESSGPAGVLTWLAVAGIRAKPVGATGWAALRFDGCAFSSDQAAERRRAEQAAKKPPSRKKAEEGPAFK